MKLWSKHLQKGRKGWKTRRFLSLAVDWRHFNWGKAELAPQGAIWRTKAQLPLSDTNLQAVQQKLFDSFNLLLKVIQEGFSLNHPQIPAANTGNALIPTHTSESSPRSYCPAQLPFPSPSGTRIREIPPQKFPPRNSPQKFPPSLL